MNGEMEELIEKLIERMQQEDYISIDRPWEAQPHDPVAPLQRWRPGRRKPAAGKIRNYRQEPRLPRFQGPARPARLARQIQLWTPRHARYGYRHRSQRRLQALRIRRHAQPRHHRHALQRHSARRPRPARSTSSTATCKSTSASTSPVARRCSCSTARTR